MSSGSAARIKFGYGELGTEIGVLVGATDRDGVLAAAGTVPVAIGWQYADDRAYDTQPRNRSVDRAVAALFAARARQEAVKLNRLGDFREAVMELREVADKIAATPAPIPSFGQSRRRSGTRSSAGPRPRRS